MKAIQSCDFLIYLVSQHSIAHGRYTLSELKFVQERWPNPIGFVLAVNIDNTPNQKIPNYLKASTVLSIAGDPAAEVRSTILKILKPKMKRIIFRRFALVLLILVPVLVSLHFYLNSLTPKIDMNLPSSTCEWKPKAAFDGRVGRVRVINNSLYPFTIFFFIPIIQLFTQSNQSPGKNFKVSY
jgi:hypothetical protein